MDTSLRNLKVIYDRYDGSRTTVNNSKVATTPYTISKSKMILRRLGGGDEAYYIYVEETDNPDESGPTKIAL
ncbi:hypothetical protein ER57_14115 [Smithella sp. SCADC]|jgi:hypothetical protein|nr:hypothetical protein ER57_14115 [Smithella sp. SCADC]